MTLNQNLQSGSAIGYLFILLVFFFAPINELLISYYLPQLPYFDFYPFFLAVILGFVYFGKISYFPIKSIHMLLFCFFLTVLVVTIFSDNVKDLDGHSTLEVNLFFLRKSIAYLILGFYCAKYLQQLKYTTYPFLVLTIIFLLLVDWNLLKFNTLSYPNKSQWGNYHYLSECYAVLSFLALCGLNQRNRALIIIFYLVSIAILFLLGSRSSLFVYILVSSLLLYRLNCLSIFFCLSLILFVITIFYSKGLLIVSSFIDDNYRMFALLISSDEGSSISRGILAQSGLRDIYENWFTGDLGGQVRHGGTLWGGYIHDFRSYWRQFGIIVFLLYCLMLLKLNVKNLFAFFSEKNTVNFFITISFLFFTVESLFARAYLSTYIFFFVGYSVSNFFKKAKYDS